MASILMVAYTNYRRDPRVKREAEALVDVGHKVVFLSRRQPGEPNRETIANVTVIKTMGLQRKCNTLFEYMVDYVLFFIMIFFHLLRYPFRYQLIHVNNMPDFLVFSTILPRLMGRPIIHDIHDLMPELYVEKFPAGENHWMVRVLKTQERWAGRFATAVLTVEERLRDILSNRGIPRDKISVLMNLPDERIFSRPEAVTKTAKSTFVLVYHGTLAHRLGLDIAIDAIARCRDAIPHLELRIIGDGEERHRLISLTEELGLTDIINFSDGFIPVEDVPGKIADADVGLIPLRVCSGTDIMLPTKLMEYVAFGIPCIVPETETIARYFDREMVQFFEAESAESLAESIVGLYSDSERRKSLARQATERFGNIYHWSKHKVLYTDLVEKLLRS